MQCGKQVNRIDCFVPNQWLAQMNHQNGLRAFPRYTATIKSNERAPFNELRFTIPFHVMDYSPGLLEKGACLRESHRIVESVGPWPSSWGDFSIHGLPMELLSTPPWTAWYTQMNSDHLHHSSFTLECEYYIKQRLRDNNSTTAATGQGWRTPLLNDRGPQAGPDNSRWLEITVPPITFNNYTNSPSHLQHRYSGPTPPLYWYYACTGILAFNIA